MNSQFVKYNRPEWEKARSKPIPFLAPLPDLNHISIDMTDSRATEQLLDLQALGIPGENYYHGEWNPPYYHSAPGSIPDLLVRETVAKKLVSINTRLLHIGIELYLFDAYRPVSVQNHFFFDWMPKYLASQNPEKGDEWARIETARFWSPGGNDPAVLTLKPPLHSTGGAVDLTLRQINGKLLEMGTMFDDLVDRSRPDYFETENPTNFTDKEAMLNRRILFHAMTDEGFVPHSLEWWHFSYGDRLWAAINESNSFYGYIELPVKACVGVS